MKKVIAFTLALLLCVSCLYGCAAKDSATPDGANDAASTKTTDDAATPAETKDSTASTDPDYTFALIVMDLSNPFFATMVDAAKAYSEAHNIELLVTDGTGDSSVQIAAMENYITMKVDGIAIMPVDGEALNDVVGQATSAGIPVITHSNKCANCTVYACPTDMDMGLAQGGATGKWIADTFGTEEKVYYAILDQSSSPNVINRVAGIKEGIAQYALCRSTAILLKWQWKLPKIL